MDNYYLKVYKDKSKLVTDDGKPELFTEGDVSEEARKRYIKIQVEFQSGFLEKFISNCKTDIDFDPLTVLTESQTHLIKHLVDSVTSEVGRALVGLTILQMSIKAIESNQSIRLHKGGGGSHNFSWTEGISMRSLDNRFITPVLRKYGLIHLNADGFMMTRSLAENYPYSKVYKANLRGARNEWLEIVEEIENQKAKPEFVLKYLINLLLNKADGFKRLADKTITDLKKLLSKQTVDRKIVEKIISSHIDASDYAARLMEIAMHSLMQSLSELNVLAPAELNKLSQMRSANKKHGNIGDIELLQEDEITEAWDAKYGKDYFRDEIEELVEKIGDHDSLKIAGFVSNKDISRAKELSSRIDEIRDLYGVEVQLIKYKDWVDMQFERAAKVGVKEDKVAKGWITAYVESLAQKRREIAPIDEPCQKWLELLNPMLSEFNA